MVLSAVGDVNHSELSKLAEKHFGDLSDDYTGVPPDVKGIRFTGSEFLYRNDCLPFMYGALAVEGVGYNHPDAIALKVASSVSQEIVLFLLHTLYLSSPLPPFPSPTFYAFCAV
ncbi:unnamed protein product [Gongylonema pulchrum]|uniref:Peptidase_M16_C domain-containing protein n=1 Tax=Gongylonema pulchrum TaxID=637853 RepID=A0A183DAR2_9BILA|nr:unnamed protein product [Gongylonema pulchrum]